MATQSPSRRRKPRKSQRRRCPIDPPFHVLVPKGTTLKTKNPKFIADPEAYQGPPILTDELKQARKYRDRSGARKFFNRFPKLRHHFRRLLVK